MLRKKGISPLIATVLIIGFTVALAAIIMTWGTSFSKGMQKTSEEQSNIQMACANDLKYTLKSACQLDADTVRVTVSNDGARDIVGLTARLYAAEDNVEAVESTPPVTALVPFEAYDISTFNFDYTLGVDIKKVELVSAIEIGGKQTPCPTALNSLGDATATGSTLEDC